MEPPVAPFEGFHTPFELVDAAGEGGCPQLVVHAAFSCDHRSKLSLVARGGGAVGMLAIRFTAKARHCLRFLQTSRLR